ncbi:MAG TPA: hypothetical protein VF605_02610 [Allosphingosinicella sp.]|jgi:hypothetical protein
MRAGIISRSAAVAGVLALVALGGWGLAQLPSPPAFTADPIGAIGHGSLFDPEGRPVNVTPQFIERTQLYYIETLLAGGNDDTRRQYESLRSRLGADGLNGQAKLLANAELIEWLLERVRPPNAARLAGNNNFLRRLLRSRISEFNQPLSVNAPKFVLPRQMVNRMRALGLDGGAQALPATATQAYLEECNRNGVPIPPDWGERGWVSKGILADEFISDNLEAEVFVYDSASPEGLCIALPRSNGNSIELLGIVCSGKQSGKACFWDNQQNKEQVAVPKGSVKRLLSFAGGPELEGGSGGICTSCHTGENPFIIHPQTTLGLPNLRGLKLRTDRWYSPMVAAAWPQNPGPASYPASDESSGDCQECHTEGGSGGRFPTFQRESFYCENVLQRATEKTMPPRKVADPDYAAHAAELVRLCKEAQ